MKVGINKEGLKRSAQLLVVLDSEMTARFKYKVSAYIKIIFKYLNKEEKGALDDEIKRLPKIKSHKRQQVITNLSKNFLVIQELKPKEKPTRDIRDYGNLRIDTDFKGLFFETFSQ